LIYVFKRNDQLKSPEAHQGQREERIRCGMILKEKNQIEKPKSTISHQKIILFELIKVIIIMKVPQVTLGGISVVIVI
jgi:hypothetical protein